MKLLPSCGRPPRPRRRRTARAAATSASGRILRCCGRGGALVAAVRAGRGGRGCAAAARSPWAEPGARDRSGAAGRQRGGALDAARRADLARRSSAAVVAARADRGRRPSTTIPPALVGPLSSTRARRRPRARWSCSTARRSSARSPARCGPPSPAAAAAPRCRRAARGGPLGRRPRCWEALVTGARAPPPRRPAPSRQPRSARCARPRPRRARVEELVAEQGVVGGRDARVRRPAGRARARGRLLCPRRSCAASSRTRGSCASPCPGPVLAVVEAAERGPRRSRSPSALPAVSVWVGDRDRGERVARELEARRLRGSTGTSTRSLDAAVRLARPTSSRAGSPRSRRGCAPPAGFRTTRSWCAPRPRPPA